MAVSLRDSTLVFDLLDRSDVKTILLAITTLLWIFLSRITCDALAEKIFAIPWFMEAVVAFDKKRFILDDMFCDNDRTDFLDRAKGCKLSAKIETNRLAFQSLE